MDVSRVENWLLRKARAASVLWNDESDGLAPPGRPRPPAIRIG
jgi:hypothetical protein